jgi:hypothetical protein
MSAINFFATSKVYGSKWNVIENRPFNNEEKAMIESASIVDADYGLSVCFMLKGGGSTYISLGKESSGFVGQEVSMDELSLLTLERQGEVCQKVIINK